VDTGTNIVTPGEAAQDASPREREFDFWIGEWDLTWGVDKRGTNRIESILDGHVIQENFDGAPAAAFRGISLSVYNHDIGKWQQTWVDNTGGYLDFTGEFRHAKMELSRTALESGKPVLQRMVWFNILQDELDWNWERSEDSGQTWQVLWSIHYTKRK
jgi:hypothetical protein